MQAITALDDAGTGALIGWGGRSTSAPSAAMLNSSFVQGFELDDYHPLAPLHSNALVLPAMLAAVPHVGTVTGEKFCSARSWAMRPGRGSARRSAAWR